MTPRVLVTYGSKRGGTAEIAERIAKTLRDRGADVDCVRAAAVPDPSPYDAVILGGALYAGRWIREARRFVARHAATLRERPTWMFSSGPLDDSAARGAAPEPRAVAGLVERTGARSHVIFGGRLARDARGFPASAMARTRAGDWRDWAAIEAWAARIADELPREPAVVHRPAPRPGRARLAALCLIVGVTAIGGGAALVAAPDGSIVRMPVSALARSPFTSYLVPGLLLLIVIGLGNLAAGLLVARDHRFANHAAFAGGFALLVWIVTEMAMLFVVHPLQLVYLAVAIAILLEALHRVPHSPSRPKRKNGPEGRFHGVSSPGASVH